MKSKSYKYDIKEEREEKKKKRRKEEKERRTRKQKERYFQREAFIPIFKKVLLKH